MDTVKIYCEQLQKSMDVPYGISLQEFVAQYDIKFTDAVLGALVNNRVRDLSYRVHKPSVISFFDYYSTHGRDLYVRSLYFLMCKTVHDLLPLKVKLHIKHSISGGKFCTLENMDGPITDDLVAKMLQYMHGLVEQDIPIVRTLEPTSEAVERFQRFGLEDKHELFKNSRQLFTSVYSMGETINYYYGFMVPSTGCLKTFGLEKYENGLLLKIPSAKNLNAMAKTRFYPKLFSVYRQHKEWVEKMGIPYIYNVNRIVEKEKLQETILVAEAFQEKHIAAVADNIHKRQHVKMVLISGPSSSGKTTTCKRLSVQLAALGYRPVQISVDDFFVEREMTPLDKDGKMDFEALEAIDLPLFNKTLTDLIAGQRVELPTFDFEAGKKLWNGKYIQLEENSIMVIEGIHCLNPKLTEQIPDAMKFKIFVSALTSLSIDRQNPIPTTDNRLIRRIVRDYNYRGYSALDTLRRWASVRAGEETNIFPYQENADEMINTSLVFELGVLKPFAMRVLLEVPECEPEYAEVIRLLKFLSFFRDIPMSTIPETSILREFLGGSKFRY